ncbi:MAG: CatB-related O-acetyltransferase [Bacteroidetes bacterium]|jgi:virginiamycin A acetyltransferase|nr:CatB-related O-acetyltransferase [Bacteroidota bacterium]MBT5990181.1 CatB-related O-acetyltransferase [Bacteroidota bacterium]MBT7995273.1 CatB-related O-acetyltransferase [Bacteroidota bacterium]
MLSIIKRKRKFRKFKKQWNEKNLHNRTTPANIFPIELVSIGNHSYGSINIFSWNTPGEKLIIGHIVSIGPGVKFVLGGNHNHNHFSTYPFKVKFLKEKFEATSKGNIIIEDDVWIGMNTLILSGVSIGKGSIIGAGSIVTKDIEPFSIVAGNPAKMIGLRFTKHIRDKLLKLDYSIIDKDFVESNTDLLYADLNENAINYIQQIFK